MGISQNPSHMLFVELENKRMLRHLRPFVEVGGFERNIQYLIRSASVFRDVQIGEQLRRYIDAARFESREEAALHARFVIASGALNHLVRSAAGKAA